VIVVFRFPKEDAVSQQAFDAFTRRAAEGVTRRKSLFALVAAALGATAAPALVEAGDRSMCNRRCAAQADTCANTVFAFCDANFGTVLDREQCNARCGACCDDLSRCDHLDVENSVYCLLGCAP
jgi:hypothetical protein